MTPHRLDTHPIHLGLGATAAPQPALTPDIEWFDDYERRTSDDGHEGRLVTSFAFDDDWDMWEMHPHGAEVVLCVAGQVRLHQEHADGSTASVALSAGEYAINPPGTWHTADVEQSTTCVFITAGANTQHRPR